MKWLSVLNDYSAHSGPIVFILISSIWSFGRTDPCQMRSQRFRISNPNGERSENPHKNLPKVLHKTPHRVSHTVRHKLPLTREKEIRSAKRNLRLLWKKQSSTAVERIVSYMFTKLRLNTRGEIVYLRAGAKVNFEPLKRISHRACLLLNRYYAPNGGLSRTDLEVQSRHIIKALREVINTYPGVDFTSKYVAIHEPPRCLLHYQAKLREYAESSKNKRLKSHMQLCLQYMEKTLHNEIKILNSIKINQFRSLELEHRHLWLLFKPGCLIYRNMGANDGRLSRVRSICGKENDEGGIVSWEICSEYTAWNGSQIGLWKSITDILHYDRCKPLCDLSAVPLSFVPDEERIWHDALERGRKFLSLCGTRHCLYHGLAFLCSIRSPDADKTDRVNVGIRSFSPRIIS